MKREEIRESQVVATRFQTDSHATKIVKKLCVLFIVVQGHIRTQSFYLYHYI